MNVQALTQRAGEWLRGSGPHSEIVLSSRIRLARNLAGFPFVNRAAAASVWKCWNAAGARSCPAGWPGTSSGWT